MQGRTIDEVKSHKHFYRDNFRRGVKLLFWLLILMLVLIVVTFYLFTTWPEADYYATSTDGKLVRILPVARGTGLVDPEDQRDLVNRENQGS
ncbi:MAG: hypothetical protein AAGG80_00280 [Pseudomonadota bacterium]